MSKNEMNTYTCDELLILIEFWNAVILQFKDTPELDLYIKQLQDVEFAWKVVATRELFNS